MFAACKKFLCKRGKNGQQKRWIKHSVWHLLLGYPLSNQ
jgi:hypothetical protein